MRAITARRVGPAYSTGVPRIWDDLYSDDERGVRAAGGYAARSPKGQRPVLLVIDVTYNFTGDRGDDHLTSVSKFFTSCGPAAWMAIPRLQQLLASAREAGVPVVYTRSQPLPERVRTALRKHSRNVGDTPEARTRGNEFTAEIAPRPGDIVIEKTRASAFFGTPLLVYLRALKADQLIVTGTSTSGCVRATVTDAFTNDYDVIVVEECVFDRFPTSHKASLFDMDSKYADVLSADEVLADLDRLRPPDRARVGAGAT